MWRICGAIIVELLALSACNVLPISAQGQTAVSNSCAEAQSGDAGKLLSARWMHGSVTVGYTYLWADQGSGERINLSGWFAKPSINIARGWSAFADFTNYDGQNSRGPLNSHGFTFGAQKSFFSQVKLGVFAEAGDLRVSNVAVTNSFLFNVGENISIPLAKHFDLSLTPAEYVMIKPPNGQSIRNDFNAKVGFSIPF